MKKNNAKTTGAGQTDSRRAHVIISVIGALITWSGVNSIYEIINKDVFMGSTSFAIGMVIFGSMLMGAGLQGYFRVKKQAKEMRP